MNFDDGAGYFYHYVRINMLMIYDIIKVQISINRGGR